MQAIFLSLPSSHWKISSLEFEVERRQKFCIDLHKGYSSMELVFVSINATIP